MVAVLSEIINLLVGGISGVAQGIGAGLSELVTNMFLTTDSTTHAVTGLSSFGGIVAVFGGVSLAIGLSTLIFKFLTSLGANH